LTPYVVLLGGIRKYFSDSGERERLLRLRAGDEFVIEGRFEGKCLLASQRFDVR
jgi:hypothetical protein